MNDHINHFEQLVYDINYNKPANTTNMEQSMVNLKFLNILMTDKSTIDKWKTFINAKSPQLEQMSTQQLYAEVRVNAANAKLAESSSSSSNEARALTKTEFQQAIQALSTRIDIFQRENGNSGRGRGNWRGRGDGREGTRGGYNNGNRGGGRGGKRSKLSYDSNKYCERHNK